MMIFLLPNIYYMFGMKLWKTVEENLARGYNTIVKGSPGCGESLASWAWALSKTSEKTNERFDGVC
jgi:hypothetical protein